MLLVGVTEALPADSELRAYGGLEQDDISDLFVFEVMLACPGFEVARGCNCLACVDGLQIYRAASRLTRICMCAQTKKPSWNEKLGAWTLNFSGRVKIASKKNFLITAETVRRRCLY